MGCMMPRCCIAASVSWALRHQACASAGWVFRSHQSASFQYDTDWSRRHAALAGGAGGEVFYFSTTSTILSVSMRTALFSPK